MISTRSISRIVALGAVVALIAAPLAANAGSATGSLAVSASIAKNCKIGNGTLAFGAYDPITTNLVANLDQTATVVVTCTKSAAGITVGFGNGLNTAGCPVATSRCLKSGTDLLNYELYSDSGRTTVWSAAIAETVTGGTTTPTTLTVYGRIPGAQDAAVGASYADTVVSTVNF